MFSQRKQGTLQADQIDFLLWLVENLDLDVLATGKILLEDVPR